MTAVLLVLVWLVLGLLVGVTDAGRLLAEAHRAQAAAALGVKAGLGQRDWLGALESGQPRLDQVEAVLACATEARRGLTAATCASSTAAITATVTLVVPVALYRTLGVQPSGVVTLTRQATGRLEWQNEP